jgi:CBS domain-containing protein
MFNSVLKAFFGQMWSIGVDASRRIEELKTGIPIGETVVIKGAEEAWSKITQILEGAKNNVTIITSSQSINRLAENDPLVKFLKKDLKVQIMASIDLDNLGPAQKLSAHYEIKHVPISYLTMMVIDNKHLFMFKTPPLTDLTVESAFYLPDTFYSSDPSQIERTAEMLNDIWKRGIDISDVSSQAGMKLPSTEIAISDNVETLVGAMVKNGVNSVLLTENKKPIGVISDRDILREIVEKQRDPRKTLAKDLQYTPLIILNKADSITTAMKIMQEKGFKRSAMVRDGQLVGMITEDTSKKKLPPK